MVSGGLKMNAAKKGAEKVGKALTGGDSNDEGDEGDNEEGGGITGTLTRGVKKGIGKLVHTFTGSSDEGEQGDDEGEEKQSRQESRGNNRDNREREPARMGRENGNRPHKLQHSKRH
jgi:hypothetical protein